MNRLVALGIVGWIAFAGLGGCQGPDPFERRDAGMTATGGHIVVGSGGHIVTGNGGSGTGGFRGSGGAGAGGTGAGGKGAGGSSMGGRGMGGTGAGGAADGGVGTGGRGAGGRIVDGGANCITAIVMAGYSAPPAPPCSACMDQNHNSYETKCTMMIDCMAGKTQPCTGNCELDCFNSVGGNGPLSGCVDAILMAGGCQ
jgi:hypothetical protein